MTVNKAAFRLDMELDNSCHCPSRCCVWIKKKGIDDMEVIVTAMGHVQKADEAALKGIEALQQSMNNLDTRVRQLAREHQKNEEDAIRYCLADLIDKRGHHSLTWAQIKTINTRIGTFLFEK